MKKVLKIIGLGLLVDIIIPIIFIITAFVVSFVSDLLQNITSSLPMSTNASTITSLLILFIGIGIIVSTGYFISKLIRKFPEKNNADTNALTKNAIIKTIVLAPIPVIIVFGFWAFTKEYGEGLASLKGLGNWIVFLGYIIVSFILDVTILNYASNKKDTTNNRADTTNNQENETDFQ